MSILVMFSRLLVCQEGLARAPALPALGIHAEWYYHQALPGQRAAEECAWRRPSTATRQPAPPAARPSAPAPAPAQGGASRAEERFRTLLEAVPSMTFEADAAGANTFASVQWQTYTGLTPEQTAGFGWTRAVIPKTSPARQRAGSRRYGTARPARCATASAVPTVRTAG